MPHTPFVIADLDGTLLHDAERFEDRALSARTIETVHAVRSRGIPVVVAPHTPFVIADLDGTLLHDAERFEDRALSARTIETVHAVRSRGIPVVVATARPVSTGLSIVQALHADACIYLNGALIDFDPSQSDYASLTGHKPSSPGSLVKNGFDSQRACEVCRAMLSVMPDLEIGIVMDDIRYTNFDVSRYWATQTWQYTDFRDVPHGIADKIIIFPRAEQTNLLHELIPDDFTVHVSEGRLWMLMAPFRDVPHGIADKIIIFPRAEQTNLLHELIPDDFTVHVSEGRLWMLMAPHANKKDAVQALCDQWGRAEQTNLLHELIPDDFTVHVSEGRLWMLMAPHANKKDAVQALCDQWGMDAQQATAFGDDMVDIGMMNLSGTGVAVANANPAVLSIADEVCPSNNDDGVAQWLEHAML